MANRFLDIFGLEHYHNLLKTEVVTATQSGATNAWTGVIDAAGLPVGKHIIYKLPSGSALGDATLNLTFSDGTTSGAIPVLGMSGTPVNYAYPTGSDIFMVYDGSSWRVTKDPGRVFKERRVITSSADLEEVVFNPSGYTYEPRDELLVDAYLNGLRLDSTEYTATVTYSAGPHINIALTDTTVTGVLEIVLRK